MIHRDVVRKYNHLLTEALESAAFRFIGNKFFGEHHVVTLRVAEGIRFLESRSETGLVDWVDAALAKGLDEAREPRSLMCRIAQKSSYDEAYRVLDLDPGSAFGFGLYEGGHRGIESAKFRTFMWKEMAGFFRRNFERRHVSRCVPVDGVLELKE